MRTGISAVIAPTGHELVKAEPYERRFIHHTIGLREGRTPHVVLGDWTVWACWIIVLAFGAAGVVGRTR